MSHAHFFMAGKKMLFVLVFFVAAAGPLAVALAARPTPQRALQKTARLEIQTSGKEKLFFARILVDPGQPVNAVGATIQFPPGQTEALEIDKKNSFCEFFPEEAIDNRNGLVRIGCGRPFPGIDRKAIVAEIVFKKKKSGTVGLRLGEDSVVLANDGYGTDVLVRAGD